MSISRSKNSGATKPTSSAELRAEKLRLEITKLRKPQVRQPSFWLSTVSAVVSLILAALIVFKNSEADIDRKILILKIKTDAAKEIRDAHMQVAQATKDTAAMKARMDEAKERPTTTSKR